MTRAPAAGERCTLTITSTCTDNGGVTVRMGPTEAAGLTLTTSDGETVTDSALYMRLTYAHTGRLWILYALLTTLLILWPGGTAKASSSIVGDS